MSTLALLVVLLLDLVGLMLIGALAYAVYRRPTLSQPLTAALTGAGVFVAAVAVIVTTGRPVISGALTRSCA
ncbi:hypothetical protein ACQEV2_00140 [Streptomyces sp. CA-251387]|uniref:hypothetical protein n=1 Tax=Streptomyces sp. CA-251387 TaxID=3240064 RepID=UPI003D90B279